MNQTTISEMETNIIPNSAQEPRKTGKATRILAVDDNPDALVAVSRLLRSAGYDVLEASTGTEGLRLAREKRPDLILLDVKLPDISGIEVCKRIKSDPETAGIFVVHLSAVETSPDSQASGLESGADGYIAQPVKYRELMARVQAMVRIMKVEKALRESEKLWRTVFAASNDILLLVDDECRIRACNEKALQSYGYFEQEMLLMNVLALFSRGTRDAAARRLEKAAEGKGVTFEAAQVRKNGDVFAVEVSGRGFLRNQQRQLILAIRDITGRKQAEERLRYLTAHDTLTGLHNRALFEEELARLQCSRMFPVSVVITDVDGLKAVNDLQGHAAGDELLRCAAAVVKSAFRPEDVVARIGGDEFAVLLPGAGEAAAEKSLKRVKNCIAEHNGARRGPRVSLSVGAATAKTSDMLMKSVKEAEERMYEEKLSAPGRARVN